MKDENLRTSRVRSSKRRILGREVLGEVLSLPDEGALSSTGLATLSTGHPPAGETALSVTFGRRAVAANANHARLKIER
jgi:hypothetical protein